MRVYDERGRSARPWLTIILDDYSRVVGGYALSLQEVVAVASQSLVIGPL